jgi:biopolymer transport protein ExbD
MSKIARDMAKDEHKGDMTPIIDVTFLLLIFFMCTLKFKTLEGKLLSYLPTDRGLASTPEQPPKEDAEIILKIPPQDWEKPPLERTVVYMRNGSNEPFGRLLRAQPGTQNPKDVALVLDPPDTLERVRAYLKRVREAAPDTKAKINAYARTPHLHVVTILNMMVEEGYTDISYSGIPNDLIKQLSEGVIR